MESDELSSVNHAPDLLMGLTAAWLDRIGVSCTGERFHLALHDNALCSGPAMDLETLLDGKPLVFRGGLVEAEYKLLALEGSLLRRIQTGKP